MMEMHKCNSLLSNNVLQLLQFDTNITTKAKLPSGKKVVPPEAQKASGSTGGTEEPPSSGGLPEAQSPPEAQPYLLEVAGGNT
jgi:hypothetical protein